MFYTLEKEIFYFMCIHMHLLSAMRWVISECFHRCLQFYMAVTHTLTGGSDPEQNPVKDVRCLPETLQSGGLPEAHELGQMVNRWGEGWRGT